MTSSQSLRRFSAGALLGFACLLMLAMCIVVVPSHIKNSNSTAVESGARARLTELIQDDLADDSQQSTAELAPKLRKLSPKQNQVVNEDLRFGRWLISHGKTDAALPYLQAYLKLDPNSIPVRIEYIKALVQARHNHEARLFCIRTLKRQLTEGETATIWENLGKCQTGW